MQDQFAIYLVQLLHEIASVQTEIVLLVVLIVTAVIVLDGVTLVAAKQRLASGIAPHSTTVSIDGSATLPEKSYVSEIQGLAGKPDALIREEGFVIPVERKPLARKIHDRYVAQLLVYMRLVEEFEGKKPPYGYLILGSNCRRIKIYNTEVRQAWLQTLINEMRDIIKGAACKPSPHPKKCRKCAVRGRCVHRWKEPDLEQTPVEVSAKARG